MEMATKPMSGIESGESVVSENFTVRLSSPMDDSPPAPAPACPMFQSRASSLLLNVHYCQYH